MMWTRSVDRLAVSAVGLLSVLSAVALAGERIFGPAAGLGPAISFTVVACYGMAGLALIPALRRRRT